MFDWDGLVPFVLTPFRLVDTCGVFGFVEAIVEVNVFLSIIFKPFVFFRVSFFKNPFISFDWLSGWLKWNKIKLITIDGFILNLDQTHKPFIFFFNDKFELDEYLFDGGCLIKFDGGLVDSTALTGVGKRGDCCLIVFGIK